MSNLIKRLEETQRGERLDLADLPHECIAKATSVRWQEDSRGRLCLYVDWLTSEGKFFTQKYTPVMFSALIKALKQLKLKTEDDLKSKWIRLRKTEVHRMANPRMIPTAIVKSAERK